MLFSMSLLALAAVLGVKAAPACTYFAIEPLFYGSSEVVYVGDRLFDAVYDSGSCTPFSGLITGPVFLYRPGDAFFIPQKVGYWNGLNYSDTGNTIYAPDVNPKGYGYRVVIEPDENSPSKTPQYSKTFPIVTQDWFDQSYSRVFLETPNPVYDITKWDSTGQQLLAFQEFSSDFDTFDVLLYQSSDVTWGPLHLAHVTGASCTSCATTEVYFEYPGKLPEGSGYQVVLVTSVNHKDQVISETGLIQIVDYPVATNTFPYSYTPIKTVVVGPTGH